MFEARLTNASTLKKIVESIKDLVSEVNLEAAPTGLSMQAMDSSHVALVCLDLQCGGFEEYRYASAVLHVQLGQELYLPFQTSSFIARLYS